MSGTRYTPSPAHAAILCVWAILAIASVATLGAQAQPTPARSAALRTDVQLTPITRKHVTIVQQSATMLADTPLLIRGPQPLHHAAADQLTIVDVGFVYPPDEQATISHTLRHTRGDDEVDVVIVIRRDASLKAKKHQVTVQLLDAAGNTPINCSGDDFLAYDETMFHCSYYDAELASIAAGTYKFVTSVVADDGSASAQKELPVSVVNQPLLTLRPQWGNCIGDSDPECEHPGLPSSTMHLEYGPTVALQGILHFVEAANSSTASTTLEILSADRRPEYRDVFTTKLDNTGRVLIRRVYKTIPTSLTALCQGTHRMRLVTTAGSYSDTWESTIWVQQDNPFSGGPGHPHCPTVAAIRGAPASFALRSGTRGPRGRALVVERIKRDSRGTLELEWQRSPFAIGCPHIANVTNDNGALPGFRRIYPGAGSFNNNSELGGAMAACRGPVAGGAISHGNVGFFVTGGLWNTQRPSNQIVWSGNKIDWVAAVHNGGSGRFSQYFILACYTGAESSGSDLLFAMAKAMNTTVTSSNGAIVNNGSDWWVEAGSVWLTASPSFRPDPVPQHGVLFAAQRGGGMRLVDRSASHLITTTNLRQVQFERILLTATGQRTRKTTIPSRTFLSALRDGEAIRLPGRPAAAVTGRLTLSWAESGRVISRTFLLLADSFLWDESNPEAYYRLSPDLVRRTF